MMSDTLTPARPRPHALRPRSSMGFSLVELLVVVAILGIIAILGGTQISKTWKRQKTQTASTDIKVLFQRALPEMQRRNMRTFLQVGPHVTVAGGPKYVPIYLVGDADGDGVLASCFANPPTVACPDLLIDEYDIIEIGKTGVKGRTGVDQEFSLSGLAVDQIETTLWSNNSTPWTVKRSIMCDFQGRAINPITNAQIAGPATLVFTHVDVVNGSLYPLTRYVININPVWSVRVAKQTTVGPFPITATNVWVTQNG